MKRWTVLVSLLMIVSATSAAAWGPNDPTDKKADPDGDGLGNLAEFLAGSNPLNPDSDGGGCGDGWEVLYGLDPTNPDDDAFDMDNDGWDNLREFQEGTHPLKANTDDDIYPIDSTDPNPLIPDGNGQEMEPGPEIPLPQPPEPYHDADNDTLPDEFEPEWGTDPYNRDSDGDQLHDGLEYAFGTDPNDPDTDDDGLWDGQELPKFLGDVNYTWTNPRRADTDGDGISDYYDDQDLDGLANWAEWTYDEDGQFHPWTLVRTADTDSDGVKDGAEVHGNDRNGGQTSDPTLPDTDGDRITDDIDPRTWVPDHLPWSRVSGNGTVTSPFFPKVVFKGVPFVVEGRIEYNVTEYDGAGTGDWAPARVAVKVQVWLEQGGQLTAISDPVTTSRFGAFKVTCTLGDDIRAGQAKLVITTTVHQRMAYIPMVWDDEVGNHLP